MCVESPVYSGTLSRGQYIEEWSHQLRHEFRERMHNEQHGTAPAPRLIPLLLGPFQRRHRLAEIRGRLLDIAMAETITRTRDD